MDRRKWYVLRAASRGEFKANSELALAGVEHFLPIYRRYSLIRHTKAQRREIVMPLMHGYLFARVDLQSGHDMAAIDGCKHISAMVKPRGADRPVHVDDRAIEQFQQLCAAGKFDQGHKRGGDNRFVDGDRVRIVEAPLAGLVVTFRDTAEGTRVPRIGCVKIILDRMFGAEMETEIEHEWIRAA